MNLSCTADSSDKTAVTNRSYFRNSY